MISAAGEYYTEYKPALGRFVKDPTTLMIINTNKDELLAFNEARKKAKDFNAMSGEITSLKNDVREIKELLLQLLGSK